MIKFDNVCKHYANGHKALKNVDLDIPRGELVFLTGHSGAGKTTLLKLILMVERASSGNITIDNHSLKNIPNRKIAAFRRKIGMVFQDHRLLMDRTVFDNVALPLAISGMHPSEIEKRVKSSLERVGLFKKENDFPEELSTGERQRVGIARAVVTRPPVILADEPTGNLDPVLAQETIALFQEFNDMGITTLIATHNLALIARLRHRIITLDDGTLIGE